MARIVLGARASVVGFGKTLCGTPHEVGRGRERVASRPTTDPLHASNIRRVDHAERRPGVRVSWLTRRLSTRESAPAKPKLPAKALDLIVDDFLDSYVSWREACEEVRNAYECWRDCKPPQRTLGFKWYRAALDREEQAAGVHWTRADRLRASVR
jgi:hypothetical protein